MVFASLKAYPELLSASGGLLVDPAEMRMDTYRFAAIIIGAFAGFVIENRFARFGTHSVKISRRVLRTVIGLIIAVIILLPVSSALYAVIGEDAGRIAKYIILAVVLVGIYPCCFAAVERKLDKKQTGI